MPVFREFNEPSEPQKQAIVLFGIAILIILGFFLTTTKKKSSKRKHLNFLRSFSYYK